MLRRLTPDALAVTGSVLGLLSLLPGWLTIKPNRLAAGMSLSLWGAAGWQPAVVIALLWFAALAISLTGKKKMRGFFLGVISNMVLVLTFMLAGVTASRLTEQGSIARVSPGGGIWAAALAAYILIFASRKMVKSPLLKWSVSWTGIIALLALLFTGWLNNLSIVQEYFAQQSRFQQELAQHIFLFGVSVVAGTLIGVPLGILSARNRHAEKPVFFITNITQTIPSLALFGILIAPLSALSFAYPVLRELGIRGVGATPAIIALTIYSLLPIIRNTFVGLRQIDPALIDAGMGMGMCRSQLFLKLEAPLAAPLILEGVRTASVQSVGNAAVAALIGAGGLGWFIFQGFGQAVPDLIMLGALPTIILAVMVDGVMWSFVRLARPRGIPLETK